MRYISALLLCLFVGLAGLAAYAQSQDNSQNDKSWLAGLIEEKLSGTGRKVQIEGFKGLLSSTASFDKLTVADDKGVWLEVDGAELSWTRTALLTGRLKVDKLTAKRIMLERLPKGQPQPKSTGFSLPSVSASTFQLPQLPVSIDVGSVGTDDLELGKAVLGQAVTAKVEAMAKLDGGSGSTRIALQRTDGRKGDVLVAAGYDAKTRDLNIDLSAVEEAGGITATALGLPDAPSVDFTFKGAAPVTNFTADLNLKTDGQQRLTGALRLQEDQNAAQGYSLTVDGDIGPLLKPEYRSFFGASISIALEGAIPKDGGTDIRKLQLATKELNLTGSASIAADGLPTSFSLDGSIQPNDPQGALLPVSGAPLRIGPSSIKAGFDANQGKTWTAELATKNVTRGAFDLGAATIKANGTIDPGSGGIGSVTAAINAALEGVVTGNPKVDPILNKGVQAAFALDWTKGQPLNLSNAQISAGDTAFDGQATFTGYQNNLRVTGKGGLTAGDLSVFSGLSGKDLKGAAKASLDGWLEPLGGALDVKLNAALTGFDMGAGTPGKLVNGDSTFTGEVIRNLDGTSVKGMQVTTPRLKASLDGGLTSNAGNLTFQAGLTDLADVAPGLNGAAMLNGTLGRKGDQFSVDVSAQGGPGLDVKLKGDAAADFSTANLTFDGSIPDLAPVVPALAGPASMTGKLQRDAQGFTYVLRAQVSPGIMADLDGTAAPDFSKAGAKLAFGVNDLSPFVAALKGSVAARGTVDYDGQISLDIGGTALTDAMFRLSGTLAPNASDANLHLTGSAPLSLAKPFLSGIDAQGDAKFDVAMKGKPGLDALSGGITGQNLTIALQAQNITLRDIQASIMLDPQARAAKNALAAAHVSLSTAVSAPGQAWEGMVTGPVTIDADVVAADAKTVKVSALNIQNGDAGYAGSVDLSDLGGAMKIATDGEARLGSFKRFSGLTGMDVGGSLSAAIKAAYALGDGTGSVSVDGKTMGIALNGNPAGAVVDGDGSFSAQARMTAQGPRLDSASVSTQALKVTVKGLDGGAFQVKAELDSLGRLVARLPGKVTAEGTVKPQGGGANIDVKASGPGGIQATAKGDISAANADLSVQGDVPLGILNTFLPKTVDVQGNSKFDLTVKGKPSLDAVSGKLTLSNGGVVVPSVNFGLRNIAGEVSLASGKAQVLVGGEGKGGGTIKVSGEAGLSGAIPIDVTVAISGLNYSLPPTLKTQLQGDLKITGSAAAPALGGKITLNETEVLLSFPPAGGAVADVQVRGASKRVKITRERAGLDATNAAPAASGGSSSGGIKLDLVIDAPSKIFLRGRGLDAELGGQVKITGTSSNLVPIGSFDLIRGRLDILARRLDLTRGSIMLQGSIDPTIDLVATTTAADVSIQIAVTGTASDPKIDFTSSPSLPEDEILALMLFGKSVDQISAFQALELAGAIRTLMGGGEGVMGSLRKKIGLDNLDISTDANGSAAVRAGKYLTKNVYADVGVNAQGEADIELNLDVTKNLTAKGKLGSGGDSSLGLYFEKDY